MNFEEIKKLKNIKYIFLQKRKKKEGKIIRMNFKKY